MKSSKDRVLDRHKRRRDKADKSLGVRQCKVCLDPIPITFEQEHHDQPQAAGGKDGPTSNLCAGCHHNLHRTADMLMSGRAGLAEDSAKIAYPDPKARERLFVLAKTVVEYMTMKRDGRIDNQAPVQIIIELPPQIKLAAQVIANDHRGATGRRLGLSTWISSLVKQEVFRRYPHLRVKQD